MDREVELLRWCTRLRDRDLRRDRGQLRVDDLLRGLRARIAFDREVADGERRAIGPRDAGRAGEMQLRDADRRRRWRSGWFEQPGQVGLAIAGLDDVRNEPVDRELVDHR